MIKKIVIVGGGFAGWYTVATLQYRLQKVELTVISSDKHPTLGVGESLGWDACSNFERLCGISDQQEFMYQTGATHKFGVIGNNFFKDAHSVTWGKFINLKASALCDFYNNFDYHQFDNIINKDPDDPGVSDYWLSLYHDKRNYHDLSVDIGENTHFASNPVAPFDSHNKYILRKATGAGHGLHIDADRSGQFLKQVVTGRNQNPDLGYSKVTHTVDAVQDVVLDNQGSIDYLLLESGNRIQADLFIDASGTSRVLMKKSANNSWRSSDERYPDSAWACPSDYVDPEKELTGATRFFGEDHGWRFQIPLFHRKGNGYIFNSRQTDPEIPLARMKEITNGTRIVEPRLITWKPGEYTTPWQGNVFPLGLSSGFIDPWANGSYEAHSRALEDLVGLLPQQESIENLAKEYNRRRSLNLEERRLRRDIPFGISQRSGPFWDSRRELARDKNVLQNLQDIILGRRTDLDQRLRHHWTHTYIRYALAAEVDIKNWDFPALPQKHVEMVAAFFDYNRQRNRYIAQTSWPNYYLWLQKNIYHYETNHDTFKRLQLEKYKNTKVKSV
jgi:tryptophan halogenase